MDEMVSTVSLEVTFAGLTDDEIIERCRFGLPPELRGPAHPAAFGSPLGRRRSFIKRGKELIEVWLLAWPSLVTDGDSVFEVEPGRLVPGTL